jgi:NADH-quinone oxidoreductase subunit C
VPTSLELAQQLRDAFGDLLSAPTEFRGEISLTVTDPTRIAEVCAHAKSQLGFNFLTDLSSIDNFESAPRWTVVYELYGLGHNAHLRLRTSVGEEVGEVPTVSGVWRTADWHEREVFDMMGIRFSGHPDLRRILMWDGYPYHPLRKDFPLAGKPTDLPEVAFTRSAPLEGGPFVTVAGGRDSIVREPRARNPEE